MTDAVIVDAVRTPLGKGKPNGPLGGVHAVDLLAHPLAALLERTGVDGELVDDVVVGAVSQVGEQGLNVARRGALAAGYPERVPATTVDRQCGSSQQAITFAAQGVLAGSYEADVDGERFTARYPDGLVPQGARLATTLRTAMEQRRARLGLQVMCEAGGLANATLYELAR